MFNILGALSSMEREIIVERTRAGLIAAAARGRRGGRPAALDELNIRAAKAMLALATCRQSNWRSSLDVRPAPCTAICRVVAPLLPRAHDAQLYRLHP